MHQNHLIYACMITLLITRALERSFIYLRQFLNFQAQFPRKSATSHFQNNKVIVPTFWALVAQLFFLCFQGADFLFDTYKN